MQPRFAAHFVVPEDCGVVACNGHQQYEDDRNEAVASNDATIKHLFTRHCAQRFIVSQGETYALIASGWSFSIFKLSMMNVCRSGVFLPM